MLFLRTLYRHTLRSVVFGIALMVLVALYIALGSGIPAVREAFEMNELQFFDAWPLKLLMLLLCANLVVVTFSRIPFTPPRYGVWTIHAGIITLIVGTALYYHYKIEGRTKIPLKATATAFYDQAERSLYVRAAGNDQSPGGEIVGVHPLPSLPRFKTYAPEKHNADALSGADLRGVQRVDLWNDPRNADQSIAQLIGAPNAVSVDVVGYYPYANTFPAVAEDPANDSTCVELRLGGVHDGMDLDDLIRASDPAHRRLDLGNYAFEHVETDAKTLDAVLADGGNLMSLDVTVRGKTQTISGVAVGGSYPVPGTGYSIFIQKYEPAFPMFGTGELVHALTFKVDAVAPATPRTFWREVLEGKPVQTDFKLDPEVTPPMMKGNRQKVPIDADLVVALHTNVPASLLPYIVPPNDSASQKHTLLTAGQNRLVDVYAAGPQVMGVHEFPDGQGTIHLQDGSAGDLPMDVRRATHLKTITDVQEVPGARRDRDEGAAGIRQVLLVRVTSGSWSDTLPVGYCENPLPARAEIGNDLVPVDPWMMGATVNVPGAAKPLQLVLGNTARPLPADLTLEKFDLVRYPGSTNDNGPFRDFVSTLKVADRDAGTWSVDKAHMNSPIYFGGGNWLFFQASYDPRGQYTVIGVGSRPAVWVMLTGFGMVVAGLMYAFYAKPAVIRVMKRKAIARAEAAKAGKGVAPAKPSRGGPVDVAPDLVTSK